MGKPSSSRGEWKPIRQYLINTLLPSTTKQQPINVSKDLIRSYYYCAFDQKKNLNSGIVIDDACYELMFVKEQNVGLINGGVKEVFVLPPSYTLNNLEGPFKFDYSGTFSTFCIKLQPWMNASYIPTQKSQVLDLNNLYPELMSELHEQLFSSECFTEMVDLAERFLNSLPIFHTKETKLIQNICGLIYAREGNITVGEIADEYDIYRQKLNRLFKQEVKYTLKTFINNVRIRSCLAYKLSNPEVSLTTIAYQFGFCDQPHFVHSFKRACGVSPSEYLKTPGYSFYV